MWSSTAEYPPALLARRRFGRAVVASIGEIGAPFSSVVYVACRSWYADARARKVRDFMYAVRRERGCRGQWERGQERWRSSTFDLISTRIASRSSAFFLSFLLCTGLAMSVSVERTSLPHIDVSIVENDMSLLYRTLLCGKDFPSSVPARYVRSSSTLCFSTLCLLPYVLPMRTVDAPAGTPTLIGREDVNSRKWIR